MHIHRLVRQLLPDPMPTRILFRLDAGRIRGLSYGHLMRCHRLACAAHSICKASSRFLMARTEEGMKVARSLGQVVTHLADASAAVEHLRWADTFVLDLPHGDDDLLRKARQEGLHTVVIDDEYGCSVAVDVVLNYSILSDPNWYPYGDRLLLGPDYCILSEEFERLFHTPMPGSNCNILVTFGGSDPTGLTNRVVEVFEDVDLPIQTTIVLGPGYPDIKLGQWLKSPTMHMVRNPPFLAPLMARCDLAIVAGGLTLYELRSLGVPAIAIASIAHEVPIVRAFAERENVFVGLTHWDVTLFTEALYATVSYCLIAKQNGSSIA